MGLGIKTRSTLSLVLGLAAALCMKLAMQGGIGPWSIPLGGELLLFGAFAVLIVLAVKITPGLGLRTPTPIEDPEKTIVIEPDREAPSESERRGE